MTDPAHPILAETDGKAILVHPVAESEVEAFLARKRAPVRTYATANKFAGKVGQVLVVPGASGAVEQVLMGVGSGRADLSLLRGLAGKLPAGDYALLRLPKGLDGEQAALGFALGTYRYDRYKKRGEPIPRLLAPKGVDVTFVTALAHACALCRDMVNTPAADMGPLQIETIAREIAEEHGATIAVVTGDDLLEQNYPSVHAVGRAAAPHRAPRIVELVWNGDRQDLPTVALVGKGVVFDSGGLDIKPSAGMRLMKKDMGGAAHALALARLVMASDLPVRLVCLVPAVENAISGDAFRPGDILATRKGLTVEVGNTDAEGRLILSDALTRAGEHAPDLTLDFATLTGAARIALGPEVIPMFTPDDALAAEFEAASRAVSDPLWRMPLWAGYREALDSDVADLRNDPDAWAQGGSVLAALFLQKFAPETGAWAHFDVFAWTPRSKPGSPAGGEAQVIRAAFEVLKSRYGKAR